MDPVFRENDALFCSGGFILVMPGPEPGIHVFDLARCVKTWMAGTGPAMTARAMTMNGDSVELIPNVESTFGADAPAHFTCRFTPPFSVSTEKPVLHFRTDAIKSMETKAALAVY